MPGRWVCPVVLSIHDRFRVGKETPIGLAVDRQMQLEPDVSSGNAYPVDYHFAGSDGRPMFLYGVPGRDKARLTTIMLSHFLLHGLTFESVIVFADQQEIPRLVLARPTNVAGAAVASLDAEQGPRRKIERLAA